MISFVNFSRIESICVVFHLGTLHGYFFHQDFWPNLNFPLEYQIKRVLKSIETVENNVEYVKITTSDKNFHEKMQHFLQIFLPGWELGSRKSVLGADFLDEKFTIQGNGDRSN